MYFTVTERRGLLHYHIVAMVFQTQDMIHSKTMHDKEVTSVWSAQIHRGTPWYPVQSRKRLFRAENSSLWLIVRPWIHAELHFFETMSCVSPLWRLLNGKGKTCYAILNSPSSSMQITLSRCSLFSRSCSSKVDFLLRKTENCFTLIKSQLFDIH